MFFSQGPGCGASIASVFRRLRLSLSVNISRMNTPICLAMVFTNIFYQNLEKLFLIECDILKIQRCVDFGFAACYTRFEFVNNLINQINGVVSDLIWHIEARILMSCLSFSSILLEQTIGA